MIRKTIYVPWSIVLAFMLVWLVIMGVLYVPRLVRTSRSEYLSVTNEQYNFSVTYPSKWRAHTYGEGGFRGQTEAKLRIFATQFDSYEIVVSHQAAHQPTVEDVAAWGLEIRQQVNEGLDSDIPEFVAEPLVEDELAGQRVLRGRYSNGQWDIEEVYVARAADMIIISLYSKGDAPEILLNEFNQIVESFRPLK